MYLKSIKKIVFSLIALVCFTQAAMADTLMKLDLVGSNEAGADVRYNGGAIVSEDDGNAASFGDQDSNIVSSIAGLPSGVGSVLIKGINFFTVTQGVGGLFSGISDNGLVEVYDNLNNLLFSAVLPAGVISGVVAGNAGGYFSTVGQVVAGSLLTNNLIQATVGISIALNNVSPSFGLSNCVNNVCNLNLFTADAVVIIDGQTVPEPLTAALLIPGLFVARRLRKNKA